MDQQKRRKREQEKQKRERLVLSKADSFPSQVDSPSVPPRFPSLKRSDGQSDELTRMSKNILGPYDACQEAMQLMNHNQQQQLLGTFEATPSTPLHAVTGNPFDRQFASGSALTGLVTKAAVTSVAASSSSSSIAQSRAELNRHSVAEAPNAATSRGEEKGGKSRWGVHNRNDHTSGPAAKIKSSSDSQFSVPNPSHRKASRYDTSSDTGSRPSNVLPVKKREKGRVRPFKSGGGSSPTGNQQGLTLPKRSTGTTASQGTGDLFKVDSEQGSLSARSNIPTIPESVSSHASSSTVPSSKRQSKIKKKHHPSSAPTSVTSPTVNSQPTVSSSAAPQSSVMRKSHSSSASLSSSSPVIQHKHRKQSSSSTSTLHSSHPLSSSSSHPPTSSTSSAKKHGDAILSSSSSLHQPPSGNPLSSSSDKERGRVGDSSAVIKSDPSFQSHLVGGVSVSSGAPRAGGDGSSAVPPSDDGSLLDERMAKKKRKKARKERVRMPQTSDRDRTKVKTDNEVKMEPVFERAESAQSSTSGCSYAPPLNQQQVTSLSNPPLTSQDPTTTGQARAKVKLEKLSKQRPSNLSIDPYGESAEGCSQDSPLDVRDVQTLLKELMYNVSVPPIITPLTTPKKSTPFTFPTAPSAGLPALESIPEAPPTGPAHLLSDSDSDSSGSSSGSSSESSDSDEDNEQGQERGEGRVGAAATASVSLEREDSTTPGWDKVLPSVNDSITPLKKTPPHSAVVTPQLSLFTLVPNAIISPLDSDPSPQQTTATSSFHSPTNTIDGNSGNFSSMGQFVLGTNVLDTVSSASVTSTSFFASGTESGSGWSSSNQPIYSQASTALDGTSRALLEGTHSSNVPLSSTGVTADPPQDMGTEDDDMGSSSNSDSDESGSESDDEMSDEGGDSSAEEEEEVEDDSTKTTQPLQGLAPGMSTGSSGLSSALFFGGDDSFSFQGETYRGFFNDDDFLSRLQSSMVGDSVPKGGDVGVMSCDPMSEGRWLQSFQAGDTQSNSTGTDVLEQVGSQLQQLASVTPAPSSSDGVSGNPTHSSNVASATSANAAVQSNNVMTSITTSATSSAARSVLSHQHSLDSASRSVGGKKRKLERQTSLNQDSSMSKLQPPARKTPRTSGVRRRESSLSCFSVSSDSSSSSSESSDEQSNAEQSPVPPTSEWTQPFKPVFPQLTATDPSASSLPSIPPSSSTTSVPPSFTSSVATSSVTTAHQVVTPKAHPPSPTSSSAAPPQQQQLEAGELEDEDVEERWEEGEIGSEVESLWVKIPLVKVDFHREQKPKAKVEPYNVTAPTKPPRRRSTIDSSSHEDLSRLPGGHHGDHDTRSLYSSRQRDDDHHGQYSRADFHRDDGRRTHRSSGWESGRDRDSWSAGRHGARINRSRDRDRDRDHHRTRDWDEYGPYDDSRSRSRGHPSNRNMNADDFLREARKRKHEADRTRTPGIDKAKAYLESVVYFMRHGDAIEREAQTWDGTQTKSPFRLYMDTVTLMKYCQSWANDCKQLLALCMRCMSVLYWKLFLLKQTTAFNIQKDLQEFFLPSKGTQKSPFLSSLSPIPSPASVGSTTSTGSGVGGASSLSSSQDPSPSSHVTVPKLIFNKAADHLTITSYLHQSMELWQQSNLIVEQYRDFFSNLDRRNGRITQFSPISVVADWLETGARLVRFRS